MNILNFSHCCAIEKSFDVDGIQIFDRVPANRVKRGTIKHNSCLKIVLSLNQKNQTQNKQPGRHTLNLQLQILQMKIFLMLFLSLAVNAENLNVKDWISDHWLNYFCGKCQFSQSTCQANIGNIRSLNATGNFNIPSDLINNSYGIQSVNFQTYITQKQTNYVFPAVNITTKSRYTVYYPNKNGQIRGVIIYYHPTIFGSWNGPSSILTAYWKSLGVFYGSQNYAVIMPDFIGFQNDSNPHPYVFYPQQIVQEALSVLDDAFKYITKFYTGPIPLFSVGYSQGGAYSVWMAKCILKRCSFSGNLDPTKYTYVRAVGLEGAYDLITMMKFLYSNVGTNIEHNNYQIQTTAVTTIGKPGLSVLALLSFSAYNLGSKSYFKIYTNDKFYDMICLVDQEKLCDIDKKHYNLISALNASAPDNKIGEAIGSSAVGKLESRQTILPYGLDENSILALYKLKILDNSTLVDLALQSSITDFASQTTKPIFVFTLAKDSLVSPLNALHFVEKGNSNVSNFTYANSNFKICQVVDGIKITEPIDHLSAEMMANIFALHFIQ